MVSKLRFRVDNCEPLMPWTRRNFLKTALGGGVSLAADGGLAAPTRRRRRRVRYGAAVSLADLQSDPRLGPAIANHCDLIVPVAELKWKALRPAPDVYDFEAADALFAFAAENELGVRGHTLVWYADMPSWTQTLDTPAAAERALVEHIERVVARYRGRARSWDVVNEAIPDVASSPRERRPSIWSSRLGGRHIELAFRTAAAVDPDAQLVLNEYDVEFVGASFAAKRAAFRNLIFELLDSGAPLHAVGLQCHLRGATPIDRDGLARFVGELHALGLKVLITELDVMDQELPASAAERDRIVAKQVSDLIGAVGAPGPPEALLTWGLTDRHSWISHIFPRQDGAPNRPLPLDADYRRKPFMDVIDQFTGAAA